MLPMLAPIRTERSARTTILKQLGVPILLATLAFALMPCGDAASSSRVMKVAHIAPDNFSWARILVDALKEIERQSDREVRFEVFPAGILGDEDELAAKLKVGDLDIAFISSLSIQHVLPELAALGVPFLVQDWEQVASLHRGLRDRIAALAETRGLVLLTWIDLGFAKVFSKYPIRAIEDVSKLRAMAVQGSVLDDDFVRMLGLQPVRTEILKVRRNLESGDMEAVFNTPLICVMLGWHDHLGYILDANLAYVFGILVMRKDRFMQVGRRTQDLILRIAREREVAINRKVPDENRSILLALEKRGWRTVAPPKALVEDMKRRTDAFLKSSGSSRIPAEWIDLVKAHSLSEP